MQKTSPHITDEDIPLLQKMSHTLGFLCADMVQKANSGHPGAPMGLSDIASVLHFHINLAPTQPQWLNRDRIIFSGGHASALVYSLLHLWGFEVSMADLHSFRQLDSKTPGHPEYRHTQGIEITTGPLGQGIANAVGMAMASKYAQNLFGREIISHNIYCLCGDGDLQEGISYEAASLAGHHALSNLILIYDSNHITIEYIAEAQDDFLELRQKAIDAAPDVYKYANLIYQSLRNLYEIYERQDKEPVFDYKEQLSTWLNEQTHEIYDYSKSVGCIPTGMTKSKKRLNKRLSEFVSGNSFIEVGDIDHSIDYLHNAAMLVIFYGKNNQIFDFNNINYFLACYKSAPSPSPFARLMYNSAIYFPPILRGQKKLIFHYPELVVVR